MVMKTQWPETAHKEHDAGLPCKQIQAGPFRKLRPTPFVESSAGHSMGLFRSGAGGAECGYMGAMSPSPPAPPASPHEFLIEFQSLGTLVRVTAIDPESGLEVVIQGPASAGQYALKQAAIRKLLFQLAKRNK